MAATSDFIALRAGPLAVDLTPEIGGSVAAFRLDGVDVMRPLSAEDRAAGNVLGVASFPMLPYANRIPGNAFDFEGRRYTFEMNNPPERFNVHGTGWHRSWTVEAVDGMSAVLGLEVTDPGESYAYRATQRFRLDAKGLDIEIDVTNLAGVRMPFGFGHHPWYERDADTVIQFDAQTCHATWADGAIGERMAVQPDESFSTPAGLPQRLLCGNYGGWSGTAWLRFPRRGLGVITKADAIFSQLVLYADPARSVFCLEPQTNASGAFTRPGGFSDPAEGIIVLAPDESARGTMRFEAFRL